MPKRKVQWICYWNIWRRLAVTSTLCTNLKFCVEMPIHQHASHVSRAKEHIEQLKK
jgi:hypothetical protein